MSVLSDQTGQEEHDIRKYGQDNQSYEQGHQKRKNALENSVQIHIMGDPFDHVDIDAYRRRNGAGFKEYDDDDAEPYGIKSRLDDHGKKDIDGDDEKGERVHKATADDVDDHDTEEDHIG